MEIIETPLTRQKAKYEAELALRDAEIADLKLKVATVRGVNEMLKLQLLDLKGMFETLHGQTIQIQTNLAELFADLPEDFG